VLIRPAFRFPATGLGNHRRPPGWSGCWSRPGYHCAAVGPCPSPPIRAFAGDLAGLHRPAPHRRKLRRCWVDEGPGRPISAHPLRGCQRSSCRSLPALRQGGGTRGCARSLPQGAAVWPRARWCCCSGQRVEPRSAVAGGRGLLWLPDLQPQCPVLASVAGGPLAAFTVARRASVAARPWTFAARLRERLGDSCLRSSPQNQDPLRLVTEHGPAIGLNGHVWPTRSLLV